MAKITLVITDNDGGNKYEHSISTGPSAWTDPEFFMLAGRNAVVGLSERIHAETCFCDAIADMTVEPVVLSGDGNAETGIVPPVLGHFCSQMHRDQFFADEGEVM